MFIAFCKICILYSRIVFLAWCIRSGVVFAAKFTIFVRKLFIRSDVHHRHIVHHRIVEHRIVNPDTHLFQEFNFIALEQWHIVRFADSGIHGTIDALALRDRVVNSGIHGTIDALGGDRVVNSGIHGTIDALGGDRVVNSVKIGLVIDVMDCDGDFVFCVDILMDVRTFFTFPTRLTKQYLIDLAEDGEGDVILARDLELVLNIRGLSDVLEPRIVLCTHWIRIVQRRWKRVFAERKRRLLKRGSITAQRRFELTGKYGVDVSTKGILRDFAICDFAICQGSTNTKIG